MNARALAWALVSGALLSAACGSPSGTPTDSQDAESGSLDRQIGKIIRDNRLTGDPARDVREPPRPLVEVGRALFFDKILGGEQNMACASCHHPVTATGDDLRLSRGVGSLGVGAAREAGPGFIIPRNAPPVWNAALLPVQFWDGRVAAVDPKNPSAGFNTPDGIHTDVTSALAAQAMFPVTSQAEMRGSAFPGMDNFQVRDALAARVAAIPEYRAMFDAAFGDDAVTPPRIATALAGFETHLMVVDTPWFDYVRGNHGAVSSSVKRGAVVFYEKARCQTCHAGDMGTDLDFHSICVPQFGPGKGDGPDAHDDFGRERVTKNPADRYKFRTPPLVNVLLHAPYGHNGAYESLEGIIRHHLDPETAVAKYDNDSGNLAPVFSTTLRDPAVLLPTMDPALKRRVALSDRDIDDLLAFLSAQTDLRGLRLNDEVPRSVPSGLPVDR